MGIPEFPPHTAFLYFSQEAYFGQVVDLVRGAHERERVLVVTTSARWDAIALRLDTAGIDWALAVRRGDLVMADAARVLDRTVRDGVFQRARFHAELRVLAGNGCPLQRIYSDAASVLVGDGNLPAALALEAAEHTMAHDGGIRICCGFDLQQFPEAEQDWQVRSVINSHQHALIEPGAWRRSVPLDTPEPPGKLRELVLLWDDYADTRTMYAEALTFSGYRVITADDAQHAFTLGDAYRPDVLVLDVRLPATLAVATMRRLRATPDFKAPILALTAHAFEGERDTILEEGFDVVLSKPCLPDALVTAVARALDHRANG